MKIDAKNQYSGNVESFQNLLNTGIKPEELNKELIELYANYSRMLLKYHEDGHSGICPLGDPDTQLFTLLQLISVTSAQAHQPLFSDLNHLQTSSKIDSSEAA